MAHIPDIRAYLIKFNLTPCTFIENRCAETSAFTTRTAHIKTYARLCAEYTRIKTRIRKQQKNKYICMFLYVCAAFFMHTRARG